MATCQNCKTAMGCSCQRRVASNGAAVCASCIMQYETNLVNTSQVKPASEVIYVKVNAPTENKTT